jgi:hypothetical protein
MNGVLTQLRRRVGRLPCCPPETAQRILELRNLGYSLRGMAKLLNDEALPTPMGRTKWSKSHVYRVLGTLYIKELGNQLAVSGSTGSIST